MPRFARFARNIFQNILLGVIVPVALLSGVAQTKPTAIKVACVGDSITFGIIPDRLHKSWPAVLQMLLGSDYDVRNFGHSGATMLKNGNLPYWSTQEFKKATAFDPDIVIVMLGTNDSKTYNWTAHGNEFTDDATALIKHFENLPAHPKIFICTPPPALSNRFAISQDNIVKGVIPDIQQVATNLNVPVIDIQNQLPKDTKYYNADGIHPNTDGEAYMAQVIVTSIKPE
ncbi:MAG TPA: GDSL-type esterase/lipase family protein [Phycisphaerae bacterium]|nr:GDSL-type esterase/lipase family protein [Phycisphaerae bacterium]